ncbi:hypothetical protein [Sporomusa sp.]|nr:hypothetical protein [Sporomusa sp.]HWR43058.1 hypothetical protein [Sporomusa sp.]
MSNIELIIGLGTKLLRGGVSRAEASETAAVEDRDVPVLNGYGSVGTKRG